MPINVNIGANLVIAKIDGLFTSAGITAANTSIIYKVEGDVIVSYSPTRSINAIRSFEANKRYYYIAKEDIDLTAFLIPPIPISEGDMTDSYWYDIQGTEGNTIAFDGTGGKADLRMKYFITVTLNNEELKKVDTINNNNQYKYNPLTGLMSFNFPLETGYISIIYR